MVIPQLPGGKISADNFQSLLDSWLAGGFIKYLDFEGVLEFALQGTSGEILAQSVYHRKEDRSMTSISPEWVTYEVAPPHLYLPNAVLPERVPLSDDKVEI